MAVIGRRTVKATSRYIIGRTELVLRKAITYLIIINMTYCCTETSALKCPHLRK